MLLDRYGVLTREHANREGGALRWSALFPALRVMELSAEVVSGLFFDAFSGPQFALPRALPRLRADAGTGGGRTFWINALDPVASCGLGAALPGMPPRRRENHLGYANGHLAIVSEHYAKRLTIHLAPDDAALDNLLPHLARLCQSRRRLATQSINGEPTEKSPYLPVLSRYLQPVADHRGVYFEPMR